MTRSHDDQGFEEDFDSELGAYLGDEVETQLVDPPVRSRAARGGDITPRPGAIQVEITDAHQQSLARLLHAHEVRLVRRASTGILAEAPGEPAGLPVQEVQAPQEDPGPGWQSTIDDEAFDLWDELATPSNRKSLRAMV